MFLVFPPERESAPSEHTRTNTMAMNGGTSDLLVKSLTVGGVAAGVVMVENSFLYGGKITSSIPVFGKPIPFPILLGSAFFCANFLAELARL